MTPLARAGQRAICLSLIRFRIEGKKKANREPNELKDEHADHPDVQARNREQVVEARLMDMVLPVPVQQQFVSEYHRGIKGRRLRVHRSLNPEQGLLPEKIDVAPYGIHNGAG